MRRQQPQDAATTEAPMSPADPKRTLVAQAGKNKVRNVSLPQTQYSSTKTCYRHRLRHPVPPRTSLTMNNKITAPIVALTIALTMPTPRWMPNLGSSQPPMKAPTIPISRSPMRPKPAPRTSCPANQPATTPTIIVTRRLSPDMFIAELHGLSRGLRGFANQRPSELRVPPIKASLRYTGWGFSSAAAAGSNATAPMLS